MSTSPIRLAVVALAGALSVISLTEDSLAQSCTQTTAAGVTTVVPCGPPLVENTVACTVPNAEQPHTGPVNARLWRKTLSSSSTQCMDGTPAVFYVRAATNPNRANDWLVILEGGGAGFDPQPGGSLDQGMEDRWTGVGSALNCRGNISTDMQGAAGLGRDGVIDPGLPIGIQLGGMMNSDPALSSFADWNWVYLNYCSSDLWTGTVNDLDLYDVVMVDAAGTEHRGFQFDFNGHNIVAEVIQQLKGAVFTTDQHPSGYPINDLDDAETVLVAGESAGGGGVRNNLDYVRAQLPNAEVYGYVGAGHSPILASPGDSWFVDADGNGRHDDEDGAERQYDQILEMGGFIDQSCEAAKPGSEYECLTMTGLHDHLSTPHALRQNLRDSLMVPSRWTAAEFRDGNVADYQAWQLDRDPWFFAPDRTEHYVITNSSYRTQSMTMCQASVGSPRPPYVLELDAWIDWGVRQNLAPISSVYTQVYDGAQMLGGKVRWITSGACPLVTVDVAVGGQWLTSPKLQATCSNVTETLNPSWSNFPQSDDLHCFDDDVMTVTCSWASSDSRDTAYLRTNASSSTYLGKDGKSKSWEVVVVPGLEVECEFEDYD